MCNQSIFQPIQFPPSRNNSTRQGNYAYVFIEKISSGNRYQIRAEYCRVMELEPSSKDILWIMNERHSGTFHQSASLLLVFLFFCSSLSLSLSIFFFSICVCCCALSTTWFRLKSTECGADLEGSNLTIEAFTGSRNLTQLARSKQVSMLSFFCSIYSLIAVCISTNIWSRFERHWNHSKWTCRWPTADGLMQTISTTRLSKETHLRRW